jgi:hypothetical protein
MHQPPGATPGVISTHRRISGVQLPEPQSIIARLGVCNRRLDLTQLRVTVEYKLNRRGVGRKQLLRHMRNRQVGRHLKCAGIRLKLAAHERQQARLPTPILARDPNLLAPKESERRIGE